VCSTYSILVLPVGFSQRSCHCLSAACAATVVITKFGSKLHCAPIVWSSVNPSLLLYGMPCSCCGHHLMLKAKDRDDVPFRAVNLGCYPDVSDLHSTPMLHLQQHEVASTHDAFFDLPHQASGKRQPFKSRQGSATVIAGRSLTPCFAAPIQQAL
jgi:hypothetical protein